jgi:hypothetical protein
MVHRESSVLKVLKVTRECREHKVLLEQMDSSV